MNGALADQPALTFDVPTGFPAVINSPSALGEPHPDRHPPGSPAAPRRRAGPGSEEGRPHRWPESTDRPPSGLTSGAVKGYFRYATVA